jgi:hypothetical protein
MFLLHATLYFCLQLTSKLIAEVGKSPGVATGSYRPKADVMAELASQRVFWSA